MKIKVGLIGFGRMGRFYLEEMQKSERWEVAYICDLNLDSREQAKRLSPRSKIVENEQEIFDDESVQVVGLFALADSRREQIERAIRSGKHIISEKPVADAIDKEWEVVDLAENHQCFSTVNLYLRNSWYHQAIKQFIDEGEIGELAILRICHMTPGLAPGEGHEYEGPAFHDCGMHYVDIARWYAGCEYKTWHAQGVNMWNYKEPWWIQCHGTFQNGIVFDITQGFVYGQLSKDQTHNSYVDIIGTKGIARMTHNFQMAKVDLHGVHQTLHIEKPFGGKNIDVLCDLFADSIETGIRNPQLPTMRDSAVASEYAWTFLQDAHKHDLPAIGELRTLDQIRERRRNMTNGYGLLQKNNPKPIINS
ncbi:Gfo/Idh/MocA family oxidoreductase [Oscillospiraceae bacterium N12]|jgi:predicted dehydrogenase|uniref:Gfo/Idh/MocA family oxidoreductase n=1 Tax=Jilunia laotingensis TaxID=2763675 RepID=A0A926IQY0_9BACT|nr:Gfo/Idh/MocA family oxidoreductase [Jilunia laotingensis]MBC8594824.1 Gfo/Idh/MocA family oxidoreductase [Jilunia laotingensis]